MTVHYATMSRLDIQKIRYIQSTFLQSKMIRLTLWQQKRKTFMNADDNHERSLELAHEQRIGIDLSV